LASPLNVIVKTRAGDGVGRAVNRQAGAGAGEGQPVGAAVEVDVPACLWTREAMPAAARSGARTWASSHRPARRRCRRVIVRAGYGFYLLLCLQSISLELLELP
jgi:hypothetical protein